MARSADERRADLLERITDYVAANGLSDLSLRPLADAVESSPRVLLYYFSSKEDLIGEVLARLRARQRDLFATLPREAVSYAQTVRAAWKLISAPEHERVFSLFFEVYGLALQDRERYAEFLRGAVDDWIGYLAASKLDDGYAPARRAGDRDGDPGRLSRLLARPARNPRPRARRPCGRTVDSRPGRHPEPEELSHDDARTTLTVPSSPSRRAAPLPRRRAAVIRDDHRGARHGRARDHRAGVRAAGRAFLARRRCARGGRHRRVRNRRSR